MAYLFNIVRFVQQNSLQLERNSG